ncbi:hypothetical protein KY492_11315 [Brevibacterium sp. PAMC21349]|nr:hypothetical protein KY492_11315 [Brevibacterium sp. PAMC21349]
MGGKDEEIWISHYRWNLLLHWKNISQAAGGEAREAAAKVKEEEKEEREALIQSLKPENNKQQPLIDYLQYKSLTQERVIVSLLGSNGTSGTGASKISNSWAGLLEKSLRADRDDLESLRFINHGHEGIQQRICWKERKLKRSFKMIPI